MSRLTICPHFLVEYPLSSPSEIELNIIGPLHSCIKESISRSIPIILSKDIINMFQNSYPWNLMQDPNWKGYLLNWHQLITANIVSRCEIISVSSQSNTKIKTCSNLSSETNQLFLNFLDAFVNKNLPGSLSEEGIISSASCHAAVSYSMCHPVVNPKDVLPVKYPWLRIYHKTLPPEGEYPFVPPRHWRQNTAPPRGPGHGYLDYNGNEWQWDNFHNNHWDVQDGTPYKNITPEGKIL